MAYRQENPPRSICPHCGQAMDHYTTYFGQGVLKLMRAKEMNHTQLADKTGFSRFGLYKVLEGKHEPQLKTLVKIGSALGVSASYLLSLIEVDMAEPMQVATPEAIQQ